MVCVESEIVAICYVDAFVETKMEKNNFMFDVFGDRLPSWNAYGGITDAVRIERHPFMFGRDVASHDILCVGI